MEGLLIAATILALVLLFVMAYQINRVANAIEHSNEIELSK